MPFGVTTISLIATWFCLLCCSLPFIVLSYVFALTNQDTNCQSEEKDPLMKLWVWVLVCGVVNTFNFIVFLICYLTWECIIGIVGYLVALLVNFLFIISWFIVGGIIIFRDNLDCVKEGTPLGVWAVIIWSLQALYLIAICCQGGQGGQASFRSKSEDN